MKNVTEIRDISYQLTRALSTGLKRIALRPVGAVSAGQQKRTGAACNLGTDAAVQEGTKEQQQRAAAGGEIEKKNNERGGTSRDDDDGEREPEEEDI